MCECKETDMRESPNDSTLAGREVHGNCGEMCHPHFRESPVSSVADPRYYIKGYSVQQVACNLNMSYCTRCSK
jgi:hypothetical protein